MEAKRIREGNARLSDILLLNPATAPFILAGIAADTSPVQADGFDIMNKEQREKAFGSGFEQWMSGITDAGLMFADPLIGAGVAAKVLRAGALGSRSTIKEASMFGRALDDDLDNLTTFLGDTRKPDEFFDEIINRPRVSPPGTALREVKENGQVLTREPWDDIPQIYNDIDLGNMPAKGALTDTLARLAMKDRTTGKKVMTVQQIERMPELTATANRGGIAQLLYDADNVYEVALALGSLKGTPKAIDRLSKLSPALANEIIRVRRAEMVMLRNSTEPQKIMDAANAFDAKIAGAQQRVQDLEQRMNRIAPDGKIGNATAEQVDSYNALKTQYDTLMKNIDESEELKRIVRGEETPDVLDTRSSMYNLDQAQAVLDDMMRREGFVSRALQADIKDAMVNARMTLPSKNTAYARAVMASRARRGEAAYQYSVEKTSLLPRRVKVKDEFGKAEYKWDFWSASQFDGVSRLRRNARVWRWFGTETPSGYIGLKGAATVNSEREFTAALDLDVYKNAPVEVTYLKEVNGVETVVTEAFGGQARRDELFQTFYKALNNPNEDSMKALMDVEQEVLNDLRMVYGFTSKESSKQFDEQLARMNRYRATDIEQIRKTGMIVDGGTEHWVPYLETHLANGTYMHNFQALEKVLRKSELDALTKGIPGRVERAMTVPSHYAGSLYDLFNDLWRPATLLRLSYTQRNVFEGMMRAAAYQASLAPLTWPIRASVNGTRNLIVKKVAAGRANRAVKALNESDFGKVWREFNESSADYYRLNAAYETKNEAGQTVMRLVTRQPDADAVVRDFTPSEYERALTAASDRVASADAAVKASVDTGAIDKAFKGTAFGDWRQRELTEVSAKIKEIEHAVSVQRSILDDLADPVMETDPQVLMQFANLTHELAQAGKMRDLLLYQPTRAMNLYTAMSARARRIGSGTSMGPDGNRYGDAFSDVLEQVNRNNLSADNTVKQTLSGRSGVWGNVFYRTAQRNNVPITYTGDNLKEFSTGIRDAIEDASSSRIVRVIMDNANDTFTEFDMDKVVDWMVSADPEAQTFMTRLMSLFGSDPVNPISLEDVARTVDTDGLVDASGKRLAPFAKRDGKIIDVDPERASVYANEVVEALSRQMQGRQEFFTLLRKRIDQKTGNAPATQLDPDEVATIIKAMSPEDKRNLGTIQGSEVIQTGMNNVLEAYSKTMAQLFHAIGAVPENAVTRGPFYNARFKAIRNDLISLYWAQNGQNIKDVTAANANFWAKRKPAKTPSGRIEGGTLEHPPFEIPAKKLGEIMQQAHRGALRDTKEWMYTIDRRTNLGKYGEWLYPFISATQNSTTVIGKLLWKEPWLAPMVTDLWRMPTRLGIEDEDGNISLPMPLPAVRDFLKDHPDIPFLGGVVDSSDMIKIPKNGLNVWMPETGYGLVPTPTPWVQVGASELMKAGAFPVETPAIFTQLFGDAGNEMYTELKKYMFGEEEGMSSRLLSWDKLLPASVQKIVAMKDEMSSQYGYQYQLQWHTQMMRFQARERDTAPTEEEIHKRTTNMFWFQFLGNMGMPTPLTPYPILTRPQVEQEPLLVLQDAYAKLRSANPETALLDMDRMFGDWALQAAMSKVTRSAGGAQPTPETVADIKTLDPLIREIAPNLGDNLSVLGILVNNRTSATEYDQNAYQWQKTKNIGGTGETWRLVQTPEQSTAERQRVAGWTVYRKAMDALDAQLASAGFTSYEVKGAAPFKAAKEQLIANMSRNPDYTAWWVDYQDIGGNRVGAAVRTMERAVQDPTFQQLMVSSGKERTLSAMQQYVEYRQMLVNVLERSGKGIEDESNLDLKMAWATIRQQLKNSDLRWGEIADIYLANDDIPRTTGYQYDPNTPLMEVPQ